MRERQDVLQAENIELLERVMQQRREIASLVNGLETVAADLDASVASLNAEDAGVHDVRDEVREVDEEMRTNS
jgi:hypothetical protein